MARRKPLAAAVEPPARRAGGPEGPSGSRHGGGRGAVELDRLIHERMRLGIVSALAVNDRLSFNDLKRLLKTTDGNLSVHARKLEEAGYIACSKRFEGRVPMTEFRLAAPGRRALERYLDHMEAIIRATRVG
ncbi:MAG TPA: transcriptional regulator [Thermoanaerobaculia bacterium]|nr:transcriptional regulator [Thermoanaerobaculia bacterium]